MKGNDATQHSYYIEHTHFAVQSKLPTQESDADALLT